MQLYILKLDLAIVVLESETEDRLLSAIEIRASQKLEVGEAVWMKSSKTSPPWPAIVIDPREHAPEVVYFSHSANGNRGYGWVQAGMIFPFLDNADRVIQELAKKNIENLRQGGYGTVQQVPKPPARRGRPPNKNKKPAVTPTSQNTAPDVAFYAPKPTNNSVDKNNSRSLTCDMKKLATILEKPAIIDNFRWINKQRTEGDAELSGSVLKVLSAKCGSGKKQGVSDENRRKTYKLSQLSTSYDEFPILSTFDQERKLLVSGSVDSDPADVVPGSSLMAKKVLPILNVTSVRSGFTQSASKFTHKRFTTFSSSIYYVYFKYSGYLYCARLLGMNCTGIMELKVIKYFCPVCMGKGKIKDASVTPSSIDKTRILCNCSQCIGTKLSPARFESHSGSRRKNWKLIVKVKGTDIKLHELVRIHLDFM
ncbi:cat eye syndrome critical region protein 2-like protein [Carex littledalei]|uniref:Cat eye syndrome critical region protein 2-like protein n=1 Tax=Carex littledalei TaxID=544730 RepID=A0A833QL37_9POAL|nr:cat eye syndrome critical region protein 2-like protein [Carex littledalei]